MRNYSDAVPHAAVSILNWFGLLHRNDSWSQGVSQETGLMRKIGFLCG